MGFELDEQIRQEEQYARREYASGAHPAPGPSMSLDGSSITIHGSIPGENDWKDRPYSNPLDGANLQV